MARGGAGVLNGRAPARLAALTVILLLAFAQGAAGLNADAIWTDELYSLANIGAFDPPYTPGQIVDSLVKHSPQHTPLFYFIAAAWAKLAGWSQLAMRLVSLCAGAVFIAWLYRLCADLFGWRAGVAAAFLAATSAFLLVSFHEIRMYTLMLALAAAHVCCYFRLARGRAGRGAAVGFVLTAAALLYTHMFSAIALAALGLHHLLFALRKGRGRRILAGWLAAILLFAPYIPVVYEGFLEETTKPSTVTSAFAAEDLLGALATLLGNGTPAICLALAALLMWRIRQGREATVMRWAGFAALMLLALLVFNHLFRLIGLYRSRYLLILWLGFMPLFAFAISAGSWQPGFTVVCLLLWAAAGWQFQRSADFSQYIGGMVSAARYPNLQNAVTGLSGKVGAHEYLLGFTGSDYINSPRKHGYSSADYYTRAQLGMDGAFVRDSLTGEALLFALDEKIDSHPYLILVSEPYAPPANLDAATAAMRDKFRVCEVVVDSDMLFARRYVDRDIHCERLPQPIDYANGIRVIDRFARYDSGGKFARAVTGWDAPEDLLGRYNMSLQVIAPDGSNVAQLDRHIDADLLRWHDARLPTADLPPGKYRLVVIVYERESMAKVAGIDGVSGQSADMQPIFDFVIADAGA